MDARHDGNENSSLSEPEADRLLDVPLEMSAFKTNMESVRIPTSGAATSLTGPDDVTGKKSSLQHFRQTLKTLKSHVMSALRMTTPVVLEDLANASLRK